MKFQTTRHFLELMLPQQLENTVVYYVENSQKIFVEFNIITFHVEHMNDERKRWKTRQIQFSFVHFRQ